jgi:hypothetical protein
LLLSCSEESTRILLELLRLAKEASSSRLVLTESTSGSGLLRLRLAEYISRLLGLILAKAGERVWLLLLLLLLLLLASLLLRLSEDVGACGRFHAKG